MIDDELDAPEDFEKEPLPEKPSLREMWENNPALKLGAIVVGGVLLIGIYFAFFSTTEEDKSVITKNIAGAKQTVGSQELDDVYRGAVQKSNEEGAQQAAQSGQSFQPVPIAVPKGGVLPIPEMPEKPQQDVLDEWKKVSEASRAKAAKEAIDEENAPVPDVIPVVQPIRPQPALKPDPDSVRHLADQMRVIIAAQAPQPSRVTLITPEESPYITYKKEQQKLAAEAAASAGNGGAGGEGGTAGSGAPKIIAPAGSVAYAQLLTELNSDIQGPVLAQVLSGPFAGGRILGEVAVQEEYMVITFSTIVKDAVSYRVSAIALDEKTTLAGQATEVDHHYLTRVALPAAAAFLTGYSSSIAQPTSEQTSTSGVGTTTTYAAASAKQSVFSGLDAAAQSISNVMQQAASRPITVKIAKGTTMGVFFLESVSTTDAAQ